MDYPLSPRIVCAALRHPDAGYLILGVRHFDPHMRVAILQINDPVIDWKVAEQGFVDAKGQFLNREDALKVALDNDQRIRRCGGDERQLYSENLY